MILFDLKCSRAHRFEAWFRDGAGYDEQQAAGEVICPFCGDDHVAKAPMAPRLSKGTARPRGKDAHRDGGRGDGARQPDGLRRELSEMRRRIVENCDYVGDRFPEEARKIHYGESEGRSIYGEASEEELRTLADEGVEVHRVLVTRWRQDS